MNRDVLPHVDKPTEGTKGATAEGEGEGEANVEAAPAKSEEKAETKPAEKPAPLFGKYLNREVLTKAN